jgi:2-keto-4-pentenoate hydratase
VSNASIDVTDRAAAIDTIAQRLVQARRGTAVSWREALPADAAAAYAVQDATLAAIGPAGGWKVGAAGQEAPPACAPLPRAGLHAGGCKLTGPAWRMCGIEVEVALRLGRDLGESPDTATLAAAIDAVMPAIEIVETRLCDWRESEPLAQLADLQSHGALVLGAPAAIDAGSLDLRRIEAYLAFDGQPVASTYGANAAGDVWRLLAWLAGHAARRGRPLRAGDVVTTGSCTGLLFAYEGAHVQAHLGGLGGVELHF